MNYTENALNIFTAKSYKGIGNAWLIKNLKGKEDVDDIVSLLNSKIKVKTNNEEFINQKRIFESKIKDKLNNHCDGFTAIGDKNFPKHYGKVNDSQKPTFLFYKGDIDLLSNNSKKISVIGLLNPTVNIEKRERDLVCRLVKEGFTIISGLANGCDSIAHEETLLQNGKTIAILPSPLQKILPASKKGLASRIVDKGGLLITEYGSEFKSRMELSSRYKERDRLQALFCETIILAASYASDSANRWKFYGEKIDSGARLAMGFAKNYNIKRAVMYDKTNDNENPMFDLNRDLIEDGVTIVSTQDISFITDKSRDMNNNLNIQGELF